MQLVGADGDAFSIIGRAKQAARAAGWTKDQISRLQEEMISGDYNHLLGVAMREFGDVGARDEDAEDEEDGYFDDFDEDEDEDEDEDDFDEGDDDLFDDEDED